MSGCWWLDEEYSYWEPFGARYDDPMTNVIDFPGKTTNDDLPSRILRAAVEADLDKCIVIGREKDGTFWFSGNFSDAYEILWLLEEAKRELVALVEEAGT